MGFQPGDIVRIKKIMQIGEIAEVLRPGFYKVVVGSLVSTCSEEQLEPAERPKSKHPDIPPPPKTKVIAERLPLKQLERLDLHGLTVAEALHALETRLNQIAVAKFDRLEVLHGHGTGRVKQAVHRYLSESPLVSSFKLDEFNTGVTRVYFWV